MKDRTTPPSKRFSCYPKSRSNYDRQKFVEQQQNAIFDNLSMYFPTPAVTEEFTRMYFTEQQPLSHPLSHPPELQPIHPPLQPTKTVQLSQYKRMQLAQPSISHLTEVPRNTVKHTEATDTGQQEPLPLDSESSLLVTLSKLTEPTTEYMDSEKIIKEIMIDVKETHMSVAGSERSAINWLNIYNIDNIMTNTITGPSRKTNVVCSSSERLSSNSSGTSDVIESKVSSNSTIRCKTTSSNTSMVSSVKNDDISSSNNSNNASTSSIISKEKRIHDSAAETKLYVKLPFKRKNTENTQLLFQDELEKLEENKENRIKKFRHNRNDNNPTNKSDTSGSNNPNNNNNEHKKIISNYDKHRNNNEMCNNTNHSNNHNIGSDNNTKNSNINFRDKDSSNSATSTTTNNINKNSTVQNKKNKNKEISVIVIEDDDNPFIKNIKKEEGEESRSSDDENYYNVVEKFCQKLLERRVPYRNVKDLNTHLSTFKNTMVKNRKTMSKEFLEQTCEQLFLDVRVEGWIALFDGQYALYQQGKRKLEIPEHDYKAHMMLPTKVIKYEDEVDGNVFENDFDHIIPALIKDESEH